MHSVHENAHKLVSRVARHVPGLLPNDLMQDEAIKKADNKSALFCLVVLAATAAVF